MLVSRLAVLSIDRRRGVAGVLLAMLVFAMLFTTVAGYYVFLNTENGSGNTATATNQSAARTVAGEHLTLNASLVSGNILLTVYNDGSVSSSVAAVFVTTNGTSSGGYKLLSKSPATNSPYLVSKTDLGIALPLNLGVGSASNHLTCGSGNCNININQAAYSYSAPAIVFIYVLTAAGNTFFTEYTAPAITTNIGTGSTTITSSTSSTSQSTVSTSTSVTSTTTTTLCNGITNSSCNGNSGLAAGTNSLVVSLKACAGPPAGSSPSTTCSSTASTVYQGGEVILTATLTNFSPVSMTVYLNLVGTSSTPGYVATNGVTLAAESPDSCGTTSGTPYPTVPAYSGTPGTATIYCTYSANQGSSGGTVTFIAYATGTYTGSTGPISITSAEATSNPQQVGNFASTLSGPWSINYFSFLYTSAQSTSPTQLISISASGNSYVAFQVSVTNTANTSLTVLEYSYLQIARIQQEQDVYLVQSAVSSTHVITADNCASNAPSAPSGAPCSPAQQSCSSAGNGCVPVGGTTTLTFAACYVGAASWQWQNTGGGNPGSGSCASGNYDGGFNAPEGVTISIVVVFSEYNPTYHTWYTFAQTLPFYGVFLST